MLMKCVLLPLLSLFGVGSSLAAHPVPEWVKDIDTSPALNEVKIEFPTMVGETLFFTAWDVEHGRELWRSDGTVEGTTLLKDVLPGSGSSFPHEVTAVGNTLYFVADDFQHGFQLWKSDGTPDGTRLVKDLAGDTASFAPRSLTSVGNKLFFLLPEQNRTKDRLWTSDGTVEGTMEVFPNKAAIYHSSLIAFKDTVVFVRGANLYRSDGTAAGTIFLGRINPVLNSVECYAGADILYFVTGRWGERRLWKSDGTPEGTAFVTDVTWGIEGTVLGNTLVFSKGDPAVGRELWTSDGTPSGTRLLKDIAADAYYADGSPVGSGPENFTVAGGFVYFTAIQSRTGRNLWRTDGTEAGTTFVFDLTNSEFAMSFQSVGEQLYFVNGGKELWVIDGTTERARLVKRESRRGNNYIYQLTSSKGMLFFVASRQLWRTDGTKNGTIQLTWLEERSDGTISASPIYSAGERACFDAFDGARMGLWASRGTGNSTTRIKNFNVWPIYDVCPLGDRVLIVAGDDKQLWVSNGTSSGTYRISDERGSGLDLKHLDLQVIGVIGNKFHFIHRSEKFTGAIWKIDGSPLEIKRVRTAGSLASTNIPATEKTVFFSQGGSLYRTDGTAKGTYGVGCEFEAGLSPLVRLGNQVYFTLGQDFVLGWQVGGLWCSDGVDNRPLIRSQYSWYTTTSQPVIFKNKVFVITASPKGYGLWSTDGTPQGTQLVIDGVSFDSSSAMSPFVVGNSLYFPGFDDAHQPRLWQSDGTVGGTSIVGANLLVQPYCHTKKQPIVVGSVVYFTAFSEMEGWELWRTDGTNDGTRMVADLTGDSASSEPDGFGLAGSRLLFWATTSERGRQLYSLDVSADLAPPP